MSRTLTRILAIAHKEVLHVLRDVRTLYLALGMPVVMLVLFGFGVSFDLDDIPMVVVDQDGTEASRELVRRILEGYEAEVVTASSVVEALDGQLDAVAVGGRADRIGAAGLIAVGRG